MIAKTFLTCRSGWGWTLATAVLLAGAMLTATGCGGDDDAESQGPPTNPNAEAEFVFANRGEVTQLDPNQMSWLQDIRLGQALWEGIYTLDPKTLEPILGCAKEVTHSDDFAHWKFTLRDDAKWSNGEPVTSDDFIFAWRRNLQEPSDYSYLLERYIVGAEDYADAYRETGADAADFSKVALRKIDDKTFEVDLTGPVPFFPDLLAFVCYWPIYEPAMEPFKLTDDAGRVSYDATWWQPGEGTPVTNGAYFLARNDLKQGQTLKMNPYYWDKKDVHSRTVRSISPIEHQLAFQRYEKGLIDWMTDIPGQQAYDMKQAGRKDLLVGPAFGTYFWSFNVDDKLRDGTPNPLADIRVRKALTAVVDKKQIVDTITRMDEMPTDVFVPKNATYFEGYKHPKGIAYDVEGAKKLLAEAGYPNGKGFPRLKLLYNTGTGDHEQIAQNLARQWREKLGVECDLDPVEMAQFKARVSPNRTGDSDGLQAGDFIVARGSWYGDYMDVTTFTDKYLPTSLNNDSGWVNPKYADLCEQASQEPDPQKRMDLLSQAEQILLDDAVILPLYHYSNTFIKNPHVTGIPMNPRNMLIMKSVVTPRSTGPAESGSGGE